MANPFLKYEPLLEERFGAFRTLLVREYKVLLAETARRGQQPHGGRSAFNQTKNKDKQVHV
ncbi:hypothetical protein [Thermus scotoductus]|uniref:hypothetical protein n=1 Tax=Thermus scotoductus TaxID=37636 RepID=UPI003F51A2DF